MNKAALLHISMFSLFACFYRRDLFLKTPALQAWTHHGIRTEQNIIYYLVNVLYITQAEIWLKSTVLGGDLQVLRVL